MLICSEGRFYDSMKINEDVLLCPSNADKRMGAPMVLPMALCAILTICSIHRVDTCWILLLPSLLSSPLMGGLKCLHAMFRDGT